MFENLNLPMIKTTLASAILVACAGLSSAPVEAQQYGNSLRPVAQNRSVPVNQPRRVQTQQRVVTRTTQVNRSQVVTRPVRVSRPVRNQRWVSPPRNAYRVQSRAFPRNARWQTDPRTYAVYSIYNGDVWYLDPTTGWGYTVDRWGVVYTADPRTSWVYSLGELARWTSDLLYFFDYYSYDRGYWRADYYNDYYRSWNSPRATYYSWNVGYDRLWGYNNYFVSQTFVTHTTTFTQTFVQDVRREVIYERANPTFVQQQTAAVGVAALQAAPPAQISTAFVPTQVTREFVQVGDQGSAVMVPVVDGQSAQIVEPLAVGEPVPVGATVFEQPVLAPVEAAPIEKYETLPVQAVDVGVVDNGGYTDLSGAKPAEETVAPTDPQPVVDSPVDANPAPYAEKLPEQGSVEPTFEDSNAGIGKESEAAQPTYEAQPEPGYEEPAQPYAEPQPDQQPVYDDSKPAEEAYEQTTPVYEESQPTYEQKEPAYEEPQQSYEQAQPAYEEPQQSYEQPEPAYEEPQQSYEQPEPAYEEPQQSYEQPESRYEEPQQSYEQPESRYEEPQQSYEQPQQSYGQPEPAYEAPQQTYEQPEPAYEQPQQSYEQPEPAYEPPQQSEPEPQPEEQKNEDGYE